MNTFKSLFAIAFLTCSVLQSSSAETFTIVYNLLQSNCAASGCHGGSNYNVFTVEGSETDVYNSIVNVASANAEAASKGYRLIDPGHPYSSFLLKKIGGTLDNYFELEAGEGETEPRGAHPLEKHEIELVRQWILHGARKTGDRVNYQLLKDYYSKGGLEFIPVPKAPSPEKGMQVRYGPIFLAPGEEVEWDKKEHLRNPEPVKVYKTDGYMSWQSHHMLLFKYDDDGSGVREGMRLVPSEAAPFNGNTTLTGAWQNDAEFELPATTAFYWKENTILDFDYHIKNYSQTEILPSDFYLNIYFDTENKRNIEMHADLVNNLALVLFRGENTRTANHNFNEDRYIYMASSHTHQWGTDFDIYLRNADGSRGEQIYEGFYDEQYTFNQGYYDWAHPPVRYFDPMVKASHGLIYETKWNVGVPFVTFGLTADDEMMLFTYMYTKEEVTASPTTVEQITIDKNDFTVYPNPFVSTATINFSVETAGNVQIEVYNLLGKKVATVVNENLNAGRYSRPLTSDALENASGIYFITMRVDGNIVATRKVSKS